jgi:hypothetical protein
MAVFRIFQRSLSKLLESEKRVVDQKCEEGGNAPCRSGIYEHGDCIYRELCRDIGFIPSENVEAIN